VHKNEDCPKQKVVVVVVVAVVSGCGDDDNNSKNSTKFFIYLRSELNSQWPITKSARIIIIITVIIT
jgi:hypothetical protein